MEGPKPRQVPSKPRYPSRGFTSSTTALWSEPPARLEFESAEEIIWSLNSSTNVTLERSSSTGNDPYTAIDRATKSPELSALQNRSPAKSVHTFSCLAQSGQTLANRRLDPHSSGRCQEIIDLPAVTMDSTRNPTQKPYFSEAVARDFGAQRTRHNLLEAGSIDDSFDCQTLDTLGNFNTTPLASQSSIAPFVPTPLPKHDHQMESLDQCRVCVLSPLHTQPAVETLLNKCWYPN